MKRIYLGMLLWLQLFFTGAVVAAPPAVTALAYSSDGKYLAAGTPGIIYLINAAGDVLDMTRVPEPKCTALAFSPDGKQLAIASGAPSQSGVLRLLVLPGLQVVQTIQAHKDLIHEVAYSPDGKRLATGSYDRLVKLWDPGTGNEINTLKDHSDAVYAVAWSPDGKRLASAAADRAVKMWDPATGKRLFTLSESTDWLYTLAWSPDGQHLAAAGVDKSIRIWQIQSEKGTLAQSAFAHEKGILKLVYSADGKTLYSLGEDRMVKAWDTGKLTEKQIYAKQSESVLALALRSLKSGPGTADELALGRFDGKLMIVDAKTGQTKAEPLPEKFPIVKITTPNDSRQNAPASKTPVTLVGVVIKAGQRSYFRFPLKASEEIGFQVKLGEGSKLEPVLELYDAHGALLTTSQERLLGLHSPSSGDYYLAIRDKEFRGGEAFTFRLQAGALPIVTAVFPLGVEAGKETPVQVQGVYLGGERVIKFIAKDEHGKSSIPLLWPMDAPKPLNLPQMAVGTFPESSINADSVSGTSAVPGTGNGRLLRPGEMHQWKFTAQRGKRLIVEVHAQRLGSPLDSVIEITDANGEPVERALLRSVAKTYITLRDRDADDRGLRLENWSDFALNDYVYAGTELLRLHGMPKGPDEDCFFWSVGGKRIGFLGTTPRAQPLGGTVYKVDKLPPHTVLPPNGFPTFKLYYRNDDGGQGFGKDSLLLFDPPADGEYQVRIQDAEGRGGERFAYRLTIRPPQPDFEVSLSSSSPNVWQGGAIPLTVTARRKDDYQGPIHLHLSDLDPRLSASEALINAEEESTTLALAASLNAENKEPIKPFTLIASATIDGKEIKKEVKSGVPKIVPSGDILIFVDRSTVSIMPGGEASITARIERRNNFKGRVPVEVRGLPYGVQVLDVGLNGILITENDTQRTFTLKAEPWVQPQSHPIVVLAKREDKNTEHAAPAILLKVALNPTASK